MLLFVWHYSRSEQWLDGILFSGSAIAITLPRREAHFPICDFTWHCHTKCSKLPFRPFTPTGPLSPGWPGAPGCPLCPGGPGNPSPGGPLGPSLPGGPGSPGTPWSPGPASSWSPWECSHHESITKPWTQSSHCHRLMKHMQKAHNSRRKELDSK